jgi:hypothetical protein
MSYVVPLLYIYKVSALGKEKRTSQECWYVATAHSLEREDEDEVTTDDDIPPTLLIR